MTVDDADVGYAVRSRENAAIDPAQGSTARDNGQLDIQPLTQEIVVSPKTMLVLLDQSSDSSARLDVACAFAKLHGAHLNALAMVQQIAPYVPAGLDAGASVIDVGQIEESRRQAQDLAKAADQQIAAHGMLGEARWASHEAFGLRETAAMHGRHADLTIAGQPALDHSLTLRESALEGALLSSGRPVLLVPNGRKQPIELRHVIVAWDASKESARALSDAAPFLDAAERVTIVVVDPKPGQESVGPNPGADIAPVIARHCNKVELDRMPSSGASIAEVIVDRAVDGGGDLIVMGGYGHSLLRETVFGGVTRQMIHDTTVPLLLSH